MDGDHESMGQDAENGRNTAVPCDRLKEAYFDRLM